MAEVYLNAVLAILTLAVAILGGMFLFLWNGIGKLQDEARADIVRLNALIDEKAGEHRNAQQQIWSEIRLQNRESTEHRNKLQEKIGELATREEMKQDLYAMEGRIQGMIRADVHRV